MALPLIGRRGSGANLVAAAGELRAVRKAMEHRNA